MFVKALRLSGFKSFASVTDLEFQAGVNVIVGPNGSGKSNIADALAWVLGSQAPSSLRGGSMEDVIFAGSQQLPALGIAEVELTLDNSARLLPLDLSEVTVARYTDRSGVSEYRINGAPCRLLDVTELLSDTGIGRSIHTVVGQGQLDDVLQARPEDRRAFIEEAAQIGKYRRRKDRALRKIERVDENLGRLGDVLSELTRAIRPLKRQATAAAQYSELMTEHRTLRQRLAATEVQRLSDESSRLDAATEARRTELLSDELSTIRARLEAAAGTRELLTTAAAQAQQVAHGIARASDRLAGLSRLATERAARIGARLAAETEEGYRERIRLLEDDGTRWRGRLTELRATSERARAGAGEETGAADTARKAKEDAENLLARLRSEETAAAQELVRAEGREAAGRATLGSIDARVQAAVERRELADRALRAAAAAVTAAQEEVRTLEVELDRATEAAAAAETRLEEAREETRRMRIRLAEAQADRAAANARVDAFQEVQAMFAGTPDVTARIDPLLEAARETAGLASADETHASHAVADAEADVERRWVEVAKHDDELRRLDALMSGATERVAGAHRQTETREIELAALDEELARARDALATAESSTIEERAALPVHRATLEQASTARSEAETVLVEARRKETAVVASATAAEMDARTAEQATLAAQMRVEEADAGIADARGALSGLADARTALEAGRARAEEIARVALMGAERASSWAKEADVRAERARAEATAEEQRLASLHERERELSRTLEELSVRRNEAEVKRAETRARTAALGERAMEEWGMTLHELLAVDGVPQDEEDDARTRVERLDREMRRLGAVNPRAAEEYAELAEREKFLTDQIEDLKSSRRDLMKVVREVDETIVQVFDEAYADVAHEFENVFGRLFPGGAGKLILTDPDDLLNSGIDVDARPPGKNVRKLSLLSGGERSLVALAFLFALFRARPSPFYLLDEVEAALDDINLQRFLGLIHELEERAQVIIVTHQKRTMEAADVLYGVSMAKDGVSRVVSKRMEEMATG
jgi:chromosome segregation protein